MHLHCKLLQKGISGQRRSDSTARCATKIKSLSFFYFLFLFLFLFSSLLFFLPKN
ncbi:hypothetical protein BDV24DRAFT_142496 [Aspergillus arachidicola]|uniref:Uncharacterized protein n=1 Tax=Aspergillus arachidicola TaxID=656916 RepID=A0A5N6XU11_9EURO|nr:hypothetical protein BDV24DRAFT_142496 [Aspergillus arachidicola]